MNLSYIFSALALLMSVVSFFYLRFYIKKRTSINIIEQDAREAVRQIINEIDRITDRDSALVEQRVKQFNEEMETRKKQLNAVLNEADRRIGVLSREVDVHVRRDDAYAKIESREQRVESRDLQNGAGLSNKEKALLMSARGVSSAQIANELGITVTEVEMAVFMQKQNG
jgi:hypothetical protein